jgi:hypothetical protein
MLWPRLLGAAQLVQPETILRWHRAGFKAFWRHPGFMVAPWSILVAPFEVIHFDQTFEG